VGGGILSGGIMSGGILSVSHPEYPFRANLPNRRVAVRLL